MSNTCCIPSYTGRADHKDPRTLRWTKVPRCRCRTRSVVDEQEVPHSRLLHYGLPSLLYFRVFKTLARLDISMGSSNTRSNLLFAALLEFELRHNAVAAAIRESACVINTTTPVKVQRIANLVAALQQCYRDECHSSLHWRR